MRSRLTCSKPAARAQPPTSGTRSGSWVRSRTCSTCGDRGLHAEGDPVEAGRRAAARGRQRSTLSGLDSVVTSAPSASPNSAPIAASTDARSAGLQQGRRPAAEEHRLDRHVAVAEHPPGQPDLRDRGARRTSPARRRRAGRPSSSRGVGVEVAVAAPHRAERHVHVEPERRAPRPRPAPCGDGAVRRRRRRRRAVRTACLASCTPASDRHVQGGDVALLDRAGHRRHLQRVAVGEDPVAVEADLREVGDAGS